jgi:hypothetical protein
MTKRLSREEIERRLLELESSPRPLDLKLGAMCYMPSPPPDQWIYVCPACGRRTAYTCEPRRGWRETPAPRPTDGARAVAEDDFQGILDLGEALSLARKLPKRSGIRVDESALCAFCRPETRDYTPALEIRVGEEPPRRVPLCHRDVVLLKAFISGAERYMAGFGRESALADAVSQLRYLLLGGPPPEGWEA